MNAITRYQVAFWGVGAALVAFALWLAYDAQFHHFYEVLLAGLLLSLLPLTIQTLGWRLLRKLYLVFIAAGLIADLVMGLWLFDVWHYSYSQLWEYGLLYVWVYPVGGLVMVQTYVALAKLLRKDFWQSRQVKKPTKPLLAVGVTAGLGVVICAILTVLLQDDPATTARVISYGAISTLALIGLELRAIYKQRRDVVGDIRAYGLVTVLALAGAAVFNTALHELPNLSAQQWTYHFSGSGSIAGLPLSLWVAWSFLVLVPVAAFYAAYSPLTSPAKKERHE